MKWTEITSEIILQHSYSILSILQKYLKDALYLPKVIEQSLVTAH